MRRNELVNHIKGSYLKQQFLEAFLVQSAYIEGLLKVFADYIYWTEVQNKIEASSPFIIELRKRIQRYSLNELINFLHKSRSIDDEQKKALHQYREKRNQVLHDLVSQISTTDFGNELQTTCELGDKIIENEKFKEIESILDQVEELIEKDRQPPIAQSGNIAKPQPTSTETDK